MRRRKSMFCVTKDDHWWIPGLGWVNGNDIEKLPHGSSSHRPGPKTLIGAERMFCSENSPVKIQVFYRRKKGWRLRYTAEK